MVRWNGFDNHYCHYGFCTWFVGVCYFDTIEKLTPFQKLLIQLPVEVAWTVIPIVILVFIGAFSLPVLFDQQKNLRVK